MQVPSLYTGAGEAAWYRYSATPGQIGASIIEGHVDTVRGPAVFFRLGALHPGDRVDVTLADGVVAVFRVTGVRLYRKSRFPAKTIYGRTRFAALHLITCGGAFDYTTRNYLSSTVVFAALVTSPPAGGRRGHAGPAHHRAPRPHRRPGHSRGQHHQLSRRVRSCSSHRGGALAVPAEHLRAVCLPRRILSIILGMRPRGELQPAEAQADGRRVRDMQPSSESQPAKAQAGAGTVHDMRPRREPQPAEAQASAGAGR